MRETFDSFLERHLREAEEAGLLRSLQDADSFGGVDFASNDYLGLAMHPALVEAACRATREHGAGSKASRLITGTRAPHRELDEKIAHFKNVEAALSFTTGYATAVGTLFAIADRNSVIILDKLCHASIVDGARMSEATLRVFPHNNLEKLESHLGWAREKHPAAQILIATEAVFSMDGDQAPLREIVEFKNRHGAILMVDEAHAVGVLGNHGRGLIDELGLRGDIEIQMGTLGKALGAAGGYIAGSRRLIDFLINRARSFIYSTSPPPAQAAAGAAAIDLLSSAEGEALRQKLWANIRLWENEQKISAESAICPIILGDEARAVSVAKHLKARGMWVPAIRYPTVARGAARLRVSLSARHTGEEIKSLGRAIRELTASA